MAHNELSPLSSLVAKGLNTLEGGDTLMALIHFEHAARIERTPVVLSCLGYCLAREKRLWGKGIALCREAIARDPGQARHYLNLGRIYLLAGQKARAIQTFRRGLKVERNHQIIVELKSLGMRRQPVIHRLDRRNPLNKYLGLFLYRLGMR